MAVDMNRYLLLFPVILTCIIILVSSSFPIHLVFSSHDTEEIVIYEFGEDLFSEESMYIRGFYLDSLASKKHYPIKCSEKVKIQFKDVETPPPESKFA